MLRASKGQQGKAPPAPSYMLGVDVGSTVMRCHVYDKEATVQGSSTKKVEVLYPQPGWVEFDHEVLWTRFVDVIKEAVQDARLQMNQISGLGIATQRATFITWNKKTGKPFHNFISWQDLRAAELVKSWNRSFLLMVLHIVFTVLHFLTQKDRYLSASLLTFTTQHVSLRLAWVLQNISEVRQAAKEDNCCFGTVDTWLLYKLTKGAAYATDFSNASSTGFFEPSKLEWSRILSKFFSIPLSVFPPVKDTSYNFGSVDPEIFGVPVPITALAADQQAAMFGECCFDLGDIKLTMGTGTFWDVNTGTKVHASRAGLYPLIGWKIGEEIAYLAEGNASDTGTAIKWAQELDFFANADETSKMAQSLDNSEGVCFVPSFSGLQVFVPSTSSWHPRGSVAEHLKPLLLLSSKKTCEVPVNDPYACASFMGLKPSTTKNHLIRAVLESIAFRNQQLYDTIVREVHIPLTYIRADGGVSNNDFIMQLTSDLIQKELNKPVVTEMSCLGAAFLAGLAAGFWTDKEQLKKLRRTAVVFEPQKKSRKYDLALDNWVKAVQRSLCWYEPTSH